MPRSTFLPAAFLLLLPTAFVPNAAAIGTISGQVTSGCPTAGTPLLGVTVDAFEVGSGDLIGSGVTDAGGNYSIPGLADGDYTVTVLTPLGYSIANADLPATVLDTQTVNADFAVACVAATGTPRVTGFWKHEFGVATGGNGNGQYDLATLCSFLDAVELHFDDNALNQVQAYDPWDGLFCQEKAMVAKGLLNAQPPPRLLASWGSYGSGPGQFTTAWDVEVDASGNVFVAEAGPSDGPNQRIQKFTASGAFVAEWGTYASGTPLGGGARGMAIGPNGDVYITAVRDDRGVDRVEVYTNSGAFITKWGTVGTGNGQFHVAFDLAVDANGNVFVTENGGNRVQKFTSTGTYLTQMGQLGSGKGQLTGPKGIAVDVDGFVYVADFNRIVKFSNDGEYVKDWPSLNPFDVAVDGNGFVYVTDPENHRLSVYNGNGGLVTTAGGDCFYGGGLLCPGLFFGVGPGGEIVQMSFPGIRKYGPLAGLTQSGNSGTPADKANQQLVALLLNVAAGNLRLTDVISNDGATVAQAITYCDQIIDSPSGDYTLAASIADRINSGQKVNSGVIPLTTAQIAYRRGLALRSFRVTPNPGPGARTFQFAIGQAGTVRLNVYDVSGRLVKEIVNRRLDEGAQRFVWDGTAEKGSVGSGVYFARLDTPGGSKTLKVIRLAR